MLTAIAEYFLENSGAEIKWGRVRQEPTTSISNSFADACMKKGGSLGGLSNDHMRNFRCARDMLQQYVFRHTKREEETDLYFCLMERGSALNLAIYSFIVSFIELVNNRYDGWVENKED